MAHSNSNLCQDSNSDYYVFDPCPDFSDPGQKFVYVWHVPCQIPVHVPRFRDYTWGDLVPIISVEKAKIKYSAFSTELTYLTYLTDAASEPEPSPSEPEPAVQPSPPPPPSPPSEEELKAIRAAYMPPPPDPLEVEEWKRYERATYMPPPPCPSEVQEWKRYERAMRLKRMRKARGVFEASEAWKLVEEREVWTPGKTWAQITAHRCP